MSIDPDLADEGSMLISTAIGELLEDAAADAVRVDGDRGWRVVVVRADRLKALGGDVTALAEAMRVLARRAAEAASEE